MTDDTMTCEQMRARILELAAERDTAIDARLTAEATLAAMTMRADGARSERDLLVRDGLERLDTIRSLRARIADLTGETTFLSERVAWHLSHGCDTAERARELALSEWRVGVMGGGA
jgi:hypothetical protein